MKLKFKIDSDYKIRDQIHFFVRSISHHLRSPLGIALDVIWLLSSNIVRVRQRLY